MSTSEQMHGPYIETSEATWRSVKSPYVAPTVTYLGTFTEITRGTDNGTNADGSDFNGS